MAILRARKYKAYPTQQAPQRDVSQQQRERTHFVGGTIGGGSKRHGTPERTDKEGHNPHSQESQALYSKPAGSSKRPRIERSAKTMVSEQERMKRMKKMSRVLGINIHQVTTSSISKGWIPSPTHRPPSHKVSPNECGLFLWRLCPAALPAFSSVPRSAPLKQIEAAECGTQHRSCTYTALSQFNATPFGLVRHAMAFETLGSTLLETKIGPIMHPPRGETYCPVAIGSHDVHLPERTSHHGYFFVHQRS